MVRGLTSKRISANIFTAKHLLLYKKLPVNDKRLDKVGEKYRRTNSVLIVASYLSEVKICTYLYQVSKQTKQTILMCLFLFVFVLNKLTLTNMKKC